MSISIQDAKVKAVQEPGQANVWSIQDERGKTVVRMPVDGDAEAWAKRIEIALNEQDLIPPNRKLASQAQQAPRSL